MPFTAFRPYLTSIHSQEENDYIQSFAHANSNVWIGLYRNTSGKHIFTSNIFTSNITRLIMSALHMLQDILFLHFRRLTGNRNTKCVEPKL